MQHKYHRVADDTFMEVCFAVKIVITRAKETVENEQKNPGRPVFVFASVTIFGIGVYLQLFPTIWVEVRVLRPQAAAKAGTFRVCGFALV